MVDSKGTTKAKRGAPKGPRIPTVERLKQQLEQAEAKAKENAGKRVAKLEEEQAKAQLDVNRATARLAKANDAVREAKVEAGLDLGEDAIGDAERISEALDGNAAYASADGDDTTVTV